jgi:hypothetical protein
MSNWETPFVWVCFNDDCSYFRRSGEWMKTQYNVSAMYRHKFDPSTGETGPLPVWSEDALKDQVVPDDECVPERSRES